MSYEMETLGNYIDIFSGFAFKSKDFIETGIPVIKIKNISAQGVTVDTESCVSKEFLKSHNKYLLKYDDMLIAMTGSHINQWSSVVGRVAKVRYYDKSLLNQRVGKIVVKDENECCLNYVYYFMLQDSTVIELAGIAGGAANQANISPSNIKGLKIPFPELETQRRIADILSAYDNLIENNQKQIKLLEEAAQRLYKEWFVDLRFPGYEDTKIVDGVPEGWIEKQLSDIADIVMGQSPKSEFYNQNQKGLPFHQGVGSYGNRFVIDDTYSTSFTRIAEPNSILFSVRAPVGRLNITKNKIVIGRGLAAIQHKNGLQSFLFYLLKDRFFKDNIVGNGSIFASITKNELYAQKFTIPNTDVDEKFNTLVEPMDKKIRALDAQISKLQEARDRLLPKLMSGELEV